MGIITVFTVVNEAKLKAVANHFFLGILFPTHRFRFHKISESHRLHATDLNPLLLLRELKVSFKI